MHDTQRGDAVHTAYIVHPVIKSSKSASVSDRDMESILEEAIGLARAIQLTVLDVRALNVSRVRSSTLLGKGQIDELGQVFEEASPDVVIINATLSPVQQRNLERCWQVKVIDRTGLILEIFGARAQTKEGRLQVDLAALAYQRSRLVRSWTHLERQRGGAGFMGGPGERQIEIDRRLIDQKIIRLKQQLKTVRRTRTLGRQARARVPYPIIALVGYTNAGKSTLFNYLTSAEVFAEDLPFATLDPTLRQITLPDNRKAILSDTVGFIADLPTHLIEAFRATLEQTIYADVIVHVIDAARTDYEAQRQDVINILNDLGIDYSQDHRVIEVLNKMDIAPLALQLEHERRMNISHNIQCISAVTGQGIDRLKHKIVKILSADHQLYQYKIPVADGKAMAWLHEHAHIDEIEYTDNNTYSNVRVFMSEHKKGQFKERFGY